MVKVQREGDRECREKAKLKAEERPATSIIIPICIRSWSSPLGVGGVEADAARHGLEDHECKNERSEVLGARCQKRGCAPVGPEVVSRLSAKAVAASQRPVDGFGAMS